MRINILDGFRGFFLVAMAITHFNMNLDVYFAKLTHHSFGWVEDAQGFVFISGIVVGLVYGKTLLKRGSIACTKAIFRRIRTIYFHQAGLIGIFLVAAMIMMAYGSRAGILEHYATNPVEFTLTSLSLLTASSNMGILPMYIWFMLATPAILWAFHNGRSAFVASLSVALWLVAQLDIGSVVLEGSLTAVFPRLSPRSFGLFFDVLAWQTLFVSGLWVGYRMATGLLNLSFLRTPMAKDIFYVCLALFVLLGIFDRIVFNELLGATYSGIALDHVDRGDLSPIYVVAFAVDLYLITWLVCASRNGELSIWSRIGSAVDWLFTRRFLVFLGQHSLHVFSAHVLIYYAMNIMVDRSQLTDLNATVILIASVLTLYPVAGLHAWHLASRNRSNIRSEMARGTVGPEISTRIT